MSFFALGKEQADTPKKMCMSETSPGSQEWGATTGHGGGRRHSRRHQGRPHRCTSSREKQQNQWGSAEEDGAVLLQGWDVEAAPLPEVGNITTTPWGGSKLHFQEYPLRWSRKKHAFF
jgi:hypothetical protein